MNRKLRIWPSVAALILVVFLAGCSSFHPNPFNPDTLRTGYITQTNKDVIVSAAAFTAEQSKRYFDLNLAKQGIQPIWLRIENNQTNALWFMPASTDPFYYSAAEIARKFSRTFSKENNNRKHLIFLEKMTIDEHVPAGDFQQGFIYGNLKKGTRISNVLLFSENNAVRFTFLFPGERIVTDHHYINFCEQYNGNQPAVNITSNSLREQIHDLPCYTANANEKKNGDPLNFIIIGTQQQLFSALIGAGWDETEALTVKTAWRTFLSFVTGKSYHTSPVSPLFVFGRRQDAAFQKTRKSIHSRSHLRLWLSPLQYNGTPVWIGQISRDIGVRMTSKTPNLTTHIIDPDVDGDRWYLIQDLLRAQTLDKIGFVSGAEYYSPYHPGHNLTGDIYYTDGLRAVLFLADHPTALDEVQFLNWALPENADDVPETENLLHAGKEAIDVTSGN